MDVHNPSSQVILEASESVHLNDSSPSPKGIKHSSVQPLVIGDQWQRLQSSTAQVLPSYLLDINFELSNVGDELALHLGDLNLHTPASAWSHPRRALTLATAFVTSIVASYAAGAYGPAGTDVEDAWGLSALTFNVGVTAYVLGFGFSPLLPALASEFYGRYRVYVAAELVLFLAHTACALTTSFIGLLIGRLLAGGAASVVSAVTAGVISDLFPEGNRRTPMTFFTLSILVGTGTGSLVSGIVVNYLSWRWMYYLQMIMVGTTTLLVLFLFQETRANMLLKRNCQIVNSHLQMLEDSGIHTATDMNPYTLQGRHVRFQVPPAYERPSAVIIWRSLITPLILIATEPTVFWCCAWVAFPWALLYMQANSIALVYRTEYGFDYGQRGAVYTALILGSIFGATLSLMYDYISQRYWIRKATSPERSLHFACVGTLFLPVGLLWFGFTANEDIHWIAPTIAIGTFSMAIFIIPHAVATYFSDIYGQYASSAVAAQGICRNLMAGAFPLFVDPMFLTLGNGSTGCLLGGIGLFLSLVPWVLCFYGSAIRKRSAFIPQLDPMEKN